jgi:hypothetical protein
MENVDYQQRNDTRFGNRFFATALISSIPVWIGILVAGLLRLPLPAFIAVIVATLSIPLSVMAVRFRWTQCPACGTKIRVPWNSGEYMRGGMLRYTCENCRIVWSTGVRPGSDI